MSLQLNVLLRSKVLTGETRSLEHFLEEQCALVPCSLSPWSYEVSHPALHCGHCCDTPPPDLLAKEPAGHGQMHAQKLELTANPLTLNWFFSGIFPTEPKSYCSHHLLKQSGSTARTPEKMWPHLWLQRSSPDALEFSRPSTNYTLLPRWRRDKHLAEQVLERDGIHLS